MDKKLNLELKRPDFDKSHLRVYYGNIGEIITQQVLRKQGFEVWLTRPIGKERDFLRIFSIPKMDEEIKKLREQYDILRRWGREETWEEYLDEHKGIINYKIETVKANRKFFGEQLDAFVNYMKKLKLDVVYERKYIPDLIAKKDGKIYVIEVKSRKGALQFLKGKRLKGLLLAREYGFFPSLVSFNLKIEADNFKMEELNE